MPNTDNRKFGADPIDVRDYQKGKLHMSRSFKNKGKTNIKEDADFVTNEQIDESFILEDAALAVSHINVVPAVTNQLGEGSCTAFALGYYQMSQEWYRKLGSSSYSTSVNVFSPEYLFNHIKTSTTCSGSAVVTGCNFLANNGCVLYATLPYEQGNCDIIATTEQKAEAIQYKMSPYTLILAKDTVAIKTALANGHCLTIQVSIDDYLLNPTTPYIWNASNAGTLIYGGHALCVVGYDDTKNAFKVVNQWGNTWGDAGFFWIDYTHFGTHVSSAFLVTIPTGVTAPKANAGYDKTVPSGTVTSLDGTTSTSGAGALTFAWSQTSGPNTAVISNAAAAVTPISNLIAGSYVFKLTVTQTDSQTSFDTVLVTVTAAAVETQTLTVARTSSKGKSTDTLTWRISHTLTPQSASLEAADTSGVYRTIFNIVPYNPQGSFGYVSKKTLNYRLKVVKSTGTVVYSSVVHS